ncbi:MAG: hypothetical protein IPM02_10025 [Betaproteobacteria bacterium]|nr:hypothetical protein [Betaproteobacteria bacterium]
MEEVDVTRKDFRQLHGHRIGQTRRVGRPEQRTSDFARAQLQARRKRRRHGLGAISTLIVLVDLQQLAIARQVA